MAFFANGGIRTINNLLLYILIDTEYLTHDIPRRSLRNRCFRSLFALTFKTSFQPHIIHLCNDFPETWKYYYMYSFEKPFDSSGLTVPLAMRPSNTTTNITSDRYTQIKPLFQLNLAFIVVIKLFPIFRILYRLRSHRRLKFAATTVDLKKKNRDIYVSLHTERCNRDLRSGCSFNLDFHYDDTRIPGAR